MSSNGGGGSNLLDMGLMVAAGVAAPEIAGAIAPEIMAAGGVEAAGVGALTGAGLSALTAAATGQNVGRSALMGGIGGGITGYMSDAATAEQLATPKVGTTLPGATVDDYGNVLPNLPSTGAPPAPALSGPVPGYVPPTPGSNFLGNTNIFSNAGSLPSNAQLYTSGGINALAGLSQRPAGAYTPPGAIYTGGNLQKFKYDPNQYTPDVVRPPSPVYQANYSGMAGAGYAEGGIAGLNTGGYIGSTAPMIAGYSVGGKTYDLGDYSDGGRLLKGPGDGMSDDIPAKIGGKQEARLADGEFVVPADVVSHLGNGSTDAGAKHLYKMMEKVRKARTGNPKQSKQIRAEKYVPA